MIDIGSLSARVGSVTVQRGLDYARRGAVSGVQITENPLTVRGEVAGTGPQPYRVTVTLRLDGSKIVALTGICSCPVSLNCKHVAALVLEGLSLRRVPGPEVPAWERWLTPLISDRPSGRGSDGALALQFELLPAEQYRGRSAPAGRAAGPPGPGRLGIRPVQRNNAGRWVRTGIGWSTLTSPGYGSQRPPAAQLEWFSALAALGEAGDLRFYGPPSSWIQLGDAGTAAFWDLLRRADDVGVPLVGSDRAQRPVELDERSAQLVLDIGRVGADLQMRSLLVAPEASSGGEAVTGLLVGDPVRALVRWPPEDDGQPPAQRALRVTRFDSPPPPELVALLAAGPQQIPADQHDRFLERYLPVLRRRITLASQDGSFEIPAPVPPALWLSVTVLAEHRTQLRWAWRYPGRERDDDLWPERSPDEHRDLGAERQILAGLPMEALGHVLEHGRLVGDTTLVGMQTVDFLLEVLPTLRDRPGLHLDIRGSAAYRAAENAPVIGISGEPSDGRDWFDLEITVTVDGEPVPLREVFLALAGGQEHLILPSGTYFPLEASTFDQLRRLIDEATLLSEPGAKALRVSRFQAGWWKELEELGVVDEQAARWNAQVSGLTGGASMVRQPLPDGFRAELRPYQQDGFDWLSFLFDAGLGGVLADDMGLGKTIQALALICRAAARPGCPPFLVVAPTSVVGNWKSEAARFAPHLQVAAVLQTSGRAAAGLAEVAAQADVVVTSYALFRLDFDRYAGREWAGLILDEAQFVKNSQSLGFKNAKRLSTPFKLAITGTPMENNLMELWALFSITAPGLFPSPSRFADYYRKPIEKLGDQDALALLRRRIKPLMLRRTKDQVVTELPPKQEQILELELNARHQKVYQTHLQQERKKVLGLIGDLDKNRFTIFRSLTLLRQLSLDPSLVDAKYTGIPSTKLDALMEQLDDVVAEGHRVLVFSQFTSFLGKVRDRLDDAGIDHCYLDGSTRRRPEVLERFRSGTAPVFLISLKAGGVGLNLTEADYCILLDPWWNPATEAQAVDRAHRIGQTRTVMVYRLVAKGTIEEKVMALKAGKAALFAGVMADDAAGSTALTADDIRGLFA